MQVAPPSSFAYSRRDISVRRSELASDLLKTIRVIGEMPISGPFPIFYHLGPLLPLITGGPVSILNDLESNQIKSKHYFSN